MAEDRAPGMDHAHYPFRRLPDAPRFTWPGDARIAFTVTLMLDAWEVNPPADASRDPRMVSPLGAFFPDWLTWSQREYGARVGIFRVLETLDAFAITPSVALGAAAAKRYPELVDELLRRNACFMAHGTFATRRITSRMNEADERALIAESREAMRAATGALPQGWCGRTSTNRRAPRRCWQKRIRLHHRLGQRRPAVSAGPLRRADAACVAPAAGMERSGVHGPAAGRRAGLGRLHRRRLRVSARRRRRVQPDTAPVRRRPGASGTVSARRTVARARPRRNLARHHR